MIGAQNDQTIAKENRMSAADKDPSWLAAVDMGSNSFHLAIARVEFGELRTLVSVSDKVQLAAGLDVDGNLSIEAMDRGLECLERYVVRLAAVPAENIRIVATNALRQANNAQQFVKEANRLLPTPIEIIAGREEARLIYQGVAHTSASSQRRLVIDIGGGSTEVVIGTNFTPSLFESTQIGCITFTTDFFADGRIRKSQFKKAISKAQSELAAIVPTYKKLGWESAVGSSGTVKAIRQMAADLKLIDPLGPLTIEALNTLIKHLMSHKHIDEIELINVKASRRSLLPAGLAILSALFECFGLKELSYCDGALREGVLHELLGRNHDQDIRLDSANSMIARYNLDSDHAHEVMQTSIMLFDQIKKAAGFKAIHRIRLKLASLLHEVGLSVSHSSYHKHSSYLIEHGDIDGFSQIEKAYVSRLARNHRRKLSDSDLADTLALGGQDLVRLCLLLRISVVLNHSRSLNRPDIELTISGKELNRWRIKVDGTQAEYPLLEADLAHEARYFSQWGHKLVSVFNSTASTEVNS